MVDFNFANIITILANTIFAGSTTVAGLASMVVIWFVILALLVNMKAPISYSLVPMIPIAIIFASFGIISTDVSLIIILVCSAMTAIAFRKVLSG